MIRLKETIKKTYSYYLWRNFFVRRRQKDDFLKWESDGRPVPPPHMAKQRMVLEYAKKYNIDTLVETGTYFGDMVCAMKDEFKSIYSIELSDFFYKNAVRQFRHYKNINIMHGDSGDVLSKLIQVLNGPALFWLDGHFSGGNTALGVDYTPVIKELENIFKSKFDNVIIIDDARCFDSDPFYPKKEEVFAFVKNKREDMQISIYHDSLIFTP